MVSTAEKNPLTLLIAKIASADAASTARTLEALPQADADQVFKALPDETAALILPFLQLNFAAAMLKDLEPESFKAAIRAIEPKRAASLLMRLPQESLERLLPHAPDKLKNEARELLVYPQGSVGRIMHTDYLAFRENQHVRDVVQRIRKLAAQRYPASYTYVVDADERLLGVISMRDLLLSEEDTQLESIIKRDVFTLDSFLDSAEAAQELGKRKYFAAPVVDAEHRMLGIVKAEQLIQGVRANVVESMQRMFGGSPDERAFSPFAFSLRKRLPWLHVNLATAFLAAFVISLFEDTIARITVLAVFLPVVAGQGGNAGAQSVAIVMRGLVMREIPSHRFRALVLKEGLLGLTTGTVTGIVTGLIAWVWQGNAVLGVVIGLGMIVNLFFAGLAGAAIPIVMKSFGWDPAQCSSIILTTVTDVVGFVAFLGFAVMFQSYLI
ncbi:MAG: magnesium transporter MgtE [Phycisphaerae bacterium]|nr:MAG: magnesium transporter MgtE [Phycisphaerae bacterium]